MPKKKPNTVKSYLAEIDRRAKESHVYQKHQLIGLLIAELLQDEIHKSLYMKLAKTRNSDDLIALARDISQRQGVKNKGAYFMRLVTEQKKQ